MVSLPAYLDAQISSATRYFEPGDAFELENGERLDAPVVAFRTWGEPGDGRAILICHALTGSADVEAWWPGMIGPDGAFDPAEDFIVCANILGGCYGTTGPVSVRPGTGERYRADFPRISVRDMVRLQKLLVTHLGIRRLDLVTGPSLGGMQALEWAAMYPETVGSIVPIGVGADHSAWCIGISEAQRTALAADPDWQGGYYGDDRPPVRGLAAARMMAVCTYRSWESFDLRFARRMRDEQTFEVQSYLRHQGEKINERFDANSYVTLTHAMHTHDLGRDRGALSDVLAALTLPALVVSVSTDTLYPPQEQQRLAKGLPNARYEVLECPHGHDGFLIETARLAAMIREFRRDLSPGSELQAVS